MKMPHRRVMHMRLPQSGDEEQGVTDGTVDVTVAE